jgi:hypothetical protein
MKLYMFRTVPLSIIRSYSLYTQQWYVIQTAFEQQQDQDGTAVPSCHPDPAAAARKLSTNLYDIYHC